MKVKLFDEILEVKEDSPAKPVVSCESLKGDGFHDSGSNPLRQVRCYYGKLGYISRSLYGRMNQDCLLRLS